MALARRADSVERGQAGPQLRIVAPVLQARIMGMGEKAKLVRKYIGDGRLMLVAARKAKRGGPSRHRIPERKPLLLGELGDHVGRDPLGERCPAEDGIDGHGLVPAGDRRAIALEKTDTSILDDADGEADHIVLLDQPLETAIQPPIVDVALVGRSRDADSLRQTR